MTAVYVASLGKIYGSRLSALDLWNLVDSGRHGNGHHDLRSDDLDESSAMTSRVKHSPASVSPLTILAPGRHMRRPSLMGTVLGQWTQFLHLFGHMILCSRGSTWLFPFRAFMALIYFLSVYLLGWRFFGRKEGARRG